MKPEELVKQIVPESVRVHSPTSVLFLCGGIVDSQSESAVTRRDAFQRIVDLGALQGHQIILAEDAKPLTMEAEYSDLLKFESVRSEPFYVVNLHDTVFEQTTDEEAIQLLQATVPHT